MKNAVIEISCNGQILKTQKKIALIPSIMEEIAVKKEWLEKCDGQIEVVVKA